jgi:hypothetical protein
MLLAFDYRFKPADRELEALKAIIGSLEALQCDV